MFSMVDLPGLFFGGLCMKDYIIAILKHLKYVLKHLALERNSVPDSIKIYSFRKVYGP